MEHQHFNYIMAQCITPYYVKQPDGSTMPVPCGKCPHCLNRRVSGWSFRLMKEEQRSIAAHFITLTYDTRYVPITEDGLMTLDKRDFQLFMKRLRKLESKTNQYAIKYYACGEYGTDNNRPHYHIILFNCLALENIQLAWNSGNIHYGAVTPASIGYTLKYMTKQKFQRARDSNPRTNVDARTPEFSLMSKRLGSNYITSQIIDWHKADLDNRMYCNLHDGKKIAMPRYYKDKIYTEMERHCIANVSAQRAEDMALEREQLMLKKHGSRAAEVQLESDFALFNKMYRNATKNRNKV